MKLSRTFVMVLVTVLVCVFSCGNVYAQNGSGTTSPVRQIFLSLDEAISIALQNNLDIQIQQYDPEIEKEDIRSAESVFDATVSSSTAQIFNEEDPQRSPEMITRLDASVNKRLSTGGNMQASINTNRSGVADTDAPDSPDAEYTTGVTVSVGHALLKGRGVDINRTPIVIAQKQREISVSELRAKIIDVISNIKTTYWSLIFVRGDLEAKRLSLQLAYDLVKINEAQVRVGILAPIEVLQAQAAAASREVDIISAEQTVHDTEDQLKLSLNISNTDPAWEASIIPTDTPLSSRQPVTLEESIRLALSNSEQLKQLRKVLEIQQISITSSENQLLPDLSVQGAVEMNGTDENWGGSFGEFVGFGEYSLTLGASFSYPLGNAAAQSALNKARLELDKSRLSIRNVEQVLINQVRQAIRAVETSYRLVEASNVALELAEQQLDAEQKKFNEGLSTNFQVLRFQDSLASARSRYTQTITGYNQALVGLDQVTSVTLERHNIVVNE